MNKPFNKLTPDQLERLALLSEELGEAQQIIGKILRHGYNSYHPHKNGPDNRTLLEIELGDVKAAIEIMTRRKDIEWDTIDEAMHSKLLRVNEYLHHNSVKI